MGDSYYVDSDIQELVAYFDEESELKYAEHTLPFLITRNIVNSKTMLFVISKCIHPEVFPMKFIEDIVAKIFRFLKKPAESLSDSSLDSLKSFSVNHNRLCYVSPRDLYNSGSDYWDNQSN